MQEDQRTDAAVDLLGPAGTGPLWGMASNDLNATLLAWPAGHELAEHTNRQAVEAWASRSSLLILRASRWFSEIPAE